MAAVAGDLLGDQRPDAAGGAGDQGRAALSQNVLKCSSDWLL